MNGPNTQERRPIKVVCAIIEQGNSFLVAQRSRRQSQAELWEFPGGKIRSAETPEDALAREIREELGVDITVGKQLRPNVHAYRDKTIELIPLLCSISGGSPVPSEHSDVRWVNAHEARSLPWSPADMPILEQYLAGDADVE
jgi:8-oxo-dGTP diphosphatase